MSDDWQWFVALISGIEAHRGRKIGKWLPSKISSWQTLSLEDRAGLIFWNVAYLNLLSTGFEIWLYANKSKDSKIKTMDFFLISDHYHFLTFFSFAYCSKVLVCFSHEVVHLPRLAANSISQSVNVISYSWCLLLFNEKKQQWKQKKTYHRSVMCADNTIILWIKL